MTDSFTLSPRVQAIDQFYKEVTLPVSTPVSLLVVRPYGDEMWLLLLGVQAITVRSRSR
ncbi:MAG TPA: hypothetical protein VGR35_23765 [Tepidisphaeraceae bacterium]|nr:hypothetical protein [Tepidisphaeraceae bacterium]